jgi:hypothetical protein
VKPEPPQGACGSIHLLSIVPARSIPLKALVRVVALGVCVVVSGAVETVQAQASNPTARRDLARACWFGGSAGGCAAAVQGSWDWIVDNVLMAVQAPMPTGRVVWDGTYSNPDAPNFYTLRGVAGAVNRASGDVCGQLPDELRADRQMLLRLTCDAERELLSAGPEHWQDEQEQLIEIRGLLAACLPPGTPAANPCGAP